MKQVFTYELVEGESNEVLIKVADQVFTLEQISAAILRRIKESAEDALDAKMSIRPSSRSRPTSTTASGKPYGQPASSPDSRCCGCSTSPPRRRSPTVSAAP